MFQFSIVDGLFHYQIKKSFCEKIQAIVDLNDSGFQKMSLSAKEYAYKKADLLQLTRQYRDAFEKTLAYSKEN